MRWRAARFVARLAGWLLTPIVIVVAGGVGAFLATLAAPNFGTRTALILVGLSGVSCSVAGLVLWMKLLRVSPELRHALAVTAEGVPQGSAVEQLFQPDPPASGGGPS